MTIYDTPTVDVVVNKKTRKEMDRAEIVVLVNIASYTADASGNYICAVEKVGARPTDGCVGAFAFGKGYGIWLGALAQAGLDVSEVSPLVWKRKMGLFGCNKDASRLLAQELFPAYAGLFKRVKDHDRAEALLIAEYARRATEGT